MTQWISIKERLPKNRERCLFFVSKSCKRYGYDYSSPPSEDRIFTGTFFNEGFYQVVSLDGIKDSVEYSSILYWRRLPEPPREE